MAPEVYSKGKPYNTSCDVYSFAVLVWQMLTLTCPYHEFTDETTFCAQVFHNNIRPSLKKITSKVCSALLERAWDSRLDERPRMEEFCKVLRQEALALEFGEEGDFDVKRRRSTFLFTKPQQENSN
jgi:serine/threonine protein kinase